jgi:hypothetical protein
MRRQTSPVPAPARQSPNVYAFRTREAVMARQHRQHYMPICRYSMSKPSDGLEPSTPPYHGPATTASHIKLSGPATPNTGTTGAALCHNPSAYYVNYHTTAFTGGAIRGQLS